MITKGIILYTACILFIYHDWLIDNLFYLLSKLYMRLTQLSDLADEQELERVSRHVESDYR